jgi:hypothetical protein
MSVIAKIMRWCKKILAAKWLLALIGLICAWTMAGGLDKVHLPQRESLVAQEELQLKAEGKEEHYSRKW